MTRENAPHDGATTGERTTATDGGVEALPADGEAATGRRDDPTTGNEARPFGAKLALVVLVLTGTVLAVVGAATADLAYLAVPVAMGGGVAAVRAARGVTEADTPRRARGSIGVVAGVVALVAGVGAASLGGPVPVVVAVAAGLGAAAVAVGALIGVDADPTDDLRRTVRRSGVAAAVATVVATLVYTGVVVAAAAFVSVNVAELATGSTYLALVSLQFLAVGVVGLYELATPIVDDWVGRAEEDGGFLEVWDRQGIGIRDVPLGYWALLAAQTFLAVFGSVHDLVDWALDSVPVLGSVIQFVFQSGLLHLPLVAAGLLAVLVLVGRAVQLGVVSWAGHEPARALSYATGGLVASAVLLPASIPPVGDLILRGIAVAAPGTSLPTVVEVVGPSATVLGGIVGVLGATYLVLGVGIPVATLSGAADRSSTAGVGAVLLFVAGAAAVVGGLHAVLAFLAAAAALLVWDLNENATGLVEQVGPRVDVRDVETTHAAGSLLVGAVGVVVATAAYYLLGVVPVPVPRTTTGGFLALVLALVALVSLGHLVVDADDDR